jgi:hypothetical protein
MQYSKECVWKCVHVCQVEYTVLQMINMLAYFTWNTVYMSAITKVAVVSKFEVMCTGNCTEGDVSCIIINL